MDYSAFSDILSQSRLNRYRWAVTDDDKAIDLYHFNIILSQQMFGLISVFEIILRNKINAIMMKETGDPDWLLHSIQPKTEPNLPYQGCFLKYETQSSANLISAALFSLGQNGYDADKLVAELGFGFWRYLFAGGKNAQFDATGKVLMAVFPNRPNTTPTQCYNQRWIFSELSTINKFRNRLAHHEPICFNHNGIKSTQYVRDTHQNILNLMNYMGIDNSQLFLKLNSITHLIIPMCDEIDAL